MDHCLFRFFISGEKNEVSPDSRLWKVSLSGENKGARTDNFSGPPHLKTSVTIGDYFSAARLFLSENDFSLLRSGLETACRRFSQAGEISNISVFLEKHGALYHPLKILVFDKNSDSCSFVLNGAVSKSGLALIEKEYHLISRLNNACLKNYLPRVFGKGFIRTDKGRIGFFLGEWFDGYNEFHVTKVQDSRAQEKRQVVIWESDGSYHYISETDALEIYQEIARILTYFYDLETFEQILPWHHAAGDFIVKRKKGKLHVRLVTVRGYALLTEFGSGEPDKKVHILPSLLFFFLNLTFRMRFDRVNGTGKTVMLKQPVIQATIEGFLCGLDEKSDGYEYGDLRSVFFEFFKQFTLKQIMEMMENILESYPPYPSETALIEENFEPHCTAIYSIFRNI